MSIKLFNTRAFFALLGAWLCFALLPVLALNPHTPRSNYPSFDRNKDLLLAQFDSLPDPDDIHAQAALGSMLLHPDMSGVEVYAVLGAIGDQIGWKGTKASDFKDPWDLMELIYGPEGDNTWTNAWDNGNEGSNWNRSVNRIVKRVKPILQNGGKVWVQEAGQSNITRDWIYKLINDEGISETVIKNNVIVVQHSQWNNDRTNSSDLSYVKNKATYVSIGDGNKSGGDHDSKTPNYNKTDSSLLSDAFSSSNPNKTAQSYWQKAKDVIDREGASGGHATIGKGGVDCSDCVENWWIFEIGDKADSLRKFFDRYVINSDSGNGGGGGGGNPVQVVFVANSDFPNIKAGAIDYYKDTYLSINALAIDASKSANRGPYARAETTFTEASGTYEVTITTVTEEDGESNYRLLVNGTQVASFQNPEVDSSGDFQPYQHTWTGISVNNGDTIAVESNADTNGKIPEGNGTAWSRGRWQRLSFSSAAGGGGGGGIQVSAGSDQTVAEDTTSSTLNASVSVSGEQTGALIYSWTQESGPATVSFGSASSEDSSVTLPQSGTYVFRLTVTDEGSLSGYDEVSVTRQSPVATGTYEEKDGLLVIEAENTSSNLGNWKKGSSVSGYTGTGYLEFTGNKYQSGGANSPITYTFKINKGGSYRLWPRAASTRPDSIPDDQGNDIFIKMEGDFSSGGTANLSDLTKNQKFFTILKNNNQWKWGEKFDMNNSHDFHWGDYNFKAGKTYTLTISGRSKSYSLDRLVFYHKSDSSKNAAQNLNLPESSRGGGGGGGAGNIAPSVNAGADQTLANAVTSTQLDGSASDDGKPTNSLTYTWTQESGPAAASFSNENAKDSSVTLPSAGTYVFRLTVSDSDKSSYDEVSVTREAVPGNAAPSVNAGADRNVAHDSTSLTLDATVSDDGLPDGTLTYQWTQVSGPSSVFATPDEEDTTVTLPEVGSYVFRLSVSDGDLSNSDELRITRQPDLGDLVYAVNAGGEAFTAADGTPFEADNYYQSGDAYSKSQAIAGTVDDTLFHSERYIKAPGTVDYSFPVANGDYLVTLMWSENTGSGRIMDVSAEAQLMIDNLDVLAKAGASKTAHEEQISVTVTDGNLSLSIAADASATEKYPNVMAIKVFKAGGGGNLAPTVDAGADQDLANSVTSTTLNATVSDDGQPNGNLSYQWTKVSGPASSFASATNEDTTVTLPEAGTYVFRLTVSDGEKSAQDDVQVIRQGTTPNTAPSVNAGADLSVAHSVNSVSLNASVSDDGLPSNNLSYSWTQESGPATASFGSASSEDSTATLPQSGTYVFRLTVSDGDLSAYDEVTVTRQAAVNGDHYLEENGIVIMEAENTPSNLGQWKKGTTLSGYTGSGYLEFTGNNYQSGGAKSPITYTFTIQNAGVYRLVPRAATTRPDSVPDDQGNDCYLKMEGDFTPGSNATLENLTKNQKFFTILKKANQWVWGRQFDMNNSHTFREAEYTFKAGETYTLTVSGRSKSYSLDRIVLYRKSDWSASAAQNTSLAESGRGAAGNQAPLVSAGEDRSVTHETSSVTLLGSVSDDGLPSGNLSSLWTQISGPTSVIGTADQQETTVTLPEVGTYVFRLTGDDSELTQSDEVSITRQPDLGDLVYAINCGGSAFTAADGTPFEADNYHQSGSSHSISGAIAATEDDSVYQSERYIKAPDSVDYSFPVDNGQYIVTLMWSENTGSGRNMDVSLEGELRIDNLDVAALAGATKTAHSEQVTVTVNDGTLNLSVAKDASASENYPNIMGIVIHRADSGGPAPTPIKLETMTPLPSGDGMTLSFDAPQAGTYTLEHCTDLVNGTWEAVEGQQVIVTKDEEVDLDAISTGTSDYYRVRFNP